MSLVSLWLPIVLSAVAVFIMSSIIHMMSPWHKSDYPKMPNEDKAMDALRPLAIPPGDYMVPRPTDMNHMKSAEFQAMYARGPVFMMTMMPSGPMEMGKTFVQWFLFCVFIGFFAALVAVHVFHPGADHRGVFHVIGLTAFGGYSFAYWPMSIWYHRAWTITIKQTVDGLIYAVLTGLIFAWLWPVT